jgi:hypothetical protein
MLVCFLSFEHSCRHILFSTDQDGLTSCRQDCGNVEQTWAWQTVGDCGMITSKFNWKHLVATGMFSIVHENDKVLGDPDC